MVLGPTQNEYFNFNRNNFYLISYLWEQYTWSKSRVDLKKILNNNTGSVPIREIHKDGILMTRVWGTLY